MGVWLQLLWEVSCDSPFTLPIEEGANNGHLLSASAWLTAGVEAVSVAAGGAGEELKADLIPLVLSCHLRPEPGGEWEADSFPSALWQATNMSLYCFNLPLPSSCWWYRPLCLGKEGVSFSKAAATASKKVAHLLPTSSSSQPSCCPGPPGPQDEHRAGSAVDGKQQKIRWGTEDRSIGYHLVWQGSCLTDHSFQKCVSVHTHT